MMANGLGDLTPSDTAREVRPPIEFFKPGTSGDQRATRDFRPRPVPSATWVEPTDADLRGLEAQLAADPELPFKGTIKVPSPAESEQTTSEVSTGNAPASASKP